METPKVIESKIICEFFEIEDSKIEKAGKSPFEYINAVIMDMVNKKKDLDIFCVTYESTHDKKAKCWNVKHTISYNPKTPSDSGAAKE